MDEARVARVTLDERSIGRRGGDVEQERAVAIYDLLECNRFVLIGAPGPYHLHLRLEEGRLLFEVADRADAPLASVAVALNAFRRIVKDYFTVCASYYEAIRTASPSRIEAIDMGRRGLHNEGAALLRERLSGRIEMDDDTARRFFTLLCVLHVKA